MPIAGLQELIVQIREVLQILWIVFGHTWWFWLFLVLLPLTRSTWLAWRQEIFRRKTKFVLLELQIPREILKGARGMDQVLQALHSLSNAPTNLMAKYWEGEVGLHFSLELVSFGGEIHFYVRTPTKLQPLVEAAFFSYYTDMELTEVDDYINALPSTYAEVEERGLGIWGAEMLLKKESAYPTRTYADFESSEEELQFDPIATFLEVLGKLKKEEIFGIQINIQPASDSWAKKWKTLVEELKKAGAKDAPIPGIKSPRQTDVLKAVEINLSKPAFNTTIRFMYLAPKAIFYGSVTRRGITGAFNQYSALDLNSFRTNFAMWTFTSIWSKPYVFPSLRALIRQQRLLYNYRKREVPSEAFMGRILRSNFFHWDHSEYVEITTQVLATVYHPPMKTVLTAPHIKRAVSKKTGPPAGISIYGEESELEKFQ